MSQARKLPKYVSKSDRGYEYRPYKGWENNQPVWGPRQVIAGPNAGLDEVWNAWELQQREVFTLAWLLDEFTSSKRFAKLSAKTREDYELYKVSLLAQRINGGVFGRVQLSDISKRTIRAYLDTYPHPVAANRRVAFLKSAWGWADERWELPANPCIGVRLNEEAPRERYVTDAEYNLVLSMAKPELAQMMELAYLCRARKSEVLGLQVDDVLEDGLRLIRLKGSEGEITMWSERLRAAVSDVRGGQYICHQYSKNAFDSAWRRLMSKAEAEGVERFTFHDLKARAVSDHVNNWAGHRGANMRKVYVRKLQKIEATA